MKLRAALVASALGLATLLPGIRAQANDVQSNQFQAQDQATSTQPLASTDTFVFPDELDFQHDVINDLHIVFNNSVTILKEDRDGTGFRKTQFNGNDKNSLGSKVDLSNPKQNVKKGQNVEVKILYVSGDAPTTAVRCWWWTIDGEPPQTASGTPIRYRSPGEGKSRDCPDPAEDGPELQNNKTHGYTPPPK